VLASIVGHHETLGRRIEQELRVKFLRYRSQERTCGRAPRWAAADKAKMVKKPDFTFRR
jgi:hypothetical protein